ncbi:hypothetical protein [Salinicola tamaricis]|uniref:hypothetical protein n=1 Tax=Salinicola tamaricis TaxID=1771309 RepID=UPI0013EC07B2|nr:hypothetical protein [Salinicola tamaricis]
MGVQRFTGANTRETMRQIRQALGEDVLILSNRVVDGGVEIVAMSEQAHAQALAGPAAEDDSNGTPTSESAAAESPAAWEAFNRRMLEDMRALLRESAAPAPAPGQAVRDAILRQLSQAGFSHVLCETLLETLPASLLDESAEEAETPAWQAWLERQLAARLEVLDSEEALFEAGGLFALVGPTGAGKTTTTAKLAARYVMRHGPREAALVTTDLPYRRRRAAAYLCAPAGCGSACARRTGRPGGTAGASGPAPPRADGTLRRQAHDG